MVSRLVTGTGMATGQKKVGGPFILVAA
jgi:hypothetical protein